MKESSVAYTPGPEQIVELYEKLDKGESIDLEWKNPGRRPPTPVVVDKPEDAAPTLEEEENKDFDFEEDFEGESVVTPQRRMPGSELKGSARKLTTSFTNVLSNMKRHRQIEEMDQSKSESK